MKKITKSIVICLGLGFALLTGACAKLNPNTEGQIDAALEAKREAFKTCYEAALARDREVQGLVALDLAFNEEPGAVTSSTVAETTISDTEMQSCVTGAASDITLPEPPTVPVEGRYDIQFQFE